VFDFNYLLKQILYKRCSNRGSKKRLAYIEHIWSKL